jgi:hypothetical protein
MKLSSLLATTTLTLACILGSTASHADDIAMSTMNNINNVVMMNNTLLLYKSDNGNKQNTNQNTAQFQAKTVNNAQSASVTHDIFYKIAMGIMLFFGTICIVVTAFFTFA